MASCDTFVPNFPERLAKNLAESEVVFSATRLGAGQPPTTMASETLAPVVPQCHDAHVAKRLSYNNNNHNNNRPSETVLCSPKQQRSANIVPGDEEYVIRNNVSCHRSFGVRQADSFPGHHAISMKTRSERDERRLFLNGLDEDWGSDSSADAEIDTSSPSIRTRQQSITTADTSVDGTLGQGSKGGYGSVASSPKTFGPLSLTDEGSWVDLEPELLGSAGHRRHASRVTGESSNSHHNEPPGTASSSKDDYCEQWQQQTLRIPARRSSLSHQTTTAILGETAHSRKTSTNSFAYDLPSQPLSPPSQTSSAQLLPHLRRPQTSGTDRDAASGRELFANHRPPPRSPSPARIKASLPVTDQLSLPPLFTKGDKPRDTMPANRKKPSRPSNPQIITSNMPGLTRVNTWLASGGGGGSQPLDPSFGLAASPSGLSPTNIRVSGEVLENLRLIVNNFPSLPLHTSCLTVQTIRSYSRKLKRVDFERRVVRAPEERVPGIPESVTSPEMSPISRKGSMSALNIMHSLRGKFTNLYGHSATARANNDSSLSVWPPPETRHVTPACHSPPPSQEEDGLEACVNSLRAIFPNGSSYLLDLLYAHLIAYNYINSLIGGLAPIAQRNGAVLMHLRGKRSMNIPAGVTSLADLQMHPDSSETMIRDFHQNTSLATARDFVPPKAAATLGLGSTATSLPVKPVPGSRRPGSKSGRFREVIAPSTAALVQSLESERALCDLRDGLALNVFRLVETIKGCSSPEEWQSHEEQEANIVDNPSKKHLEPAFMRTLCELVRCYEELYG